MNVIMTNGPFGLIGIETENGFIYFNGNGCYDQNGKKITGIKAKKILEAA